VGGLGSSVLRAYNPVSWFHARGIFRVLGKLKPRLPDVSRCLFITFTVNPTLFESPQSAFTHARSRLRRVFYRLRKGVEWQGKFYQNNAPYCVKVEFHRSGWAHFHVVFLSKRYVPGELVSELWSFGRTDVRRISSSKFHYLLKYVTKGGALPDWVLNFKRLRVWQATAGFYNATPTIEEKEAEKPNKPYRFRKRASLSIGERLVRWSHTAVLKCGEEFRQVILGAPFADLFAELVFSVAQEGRYLGGGQILINDTEDILPWIQPNPLPQQ
jgi:hypothetical protein